VKSALQTEDKDIILADLSKRETFVTAKKIFAHSFDLYKEENIVFNLKKLDS